MKANGYWTSVLLMSLILLVSLAAKRLLGSIVSPLNTHTGLGTASNGFLMPPRQFIRSPATARPTAEFDAQHCRAICSSGAIG